MTRKKKSKVTSYPLSDHYDGKHFFNLDGSKIKKSYRHLFKMIRAIRKNRWPKFLDNNKKPQLIDELALNQARITYINHATHLIQLHQLNLLTDPVFSKRVGPLNIVGPKRIKQPGIPLNDLPHIHVVLVSHNHYDHMDMYSLKQLDKKFNPLFILPLGNGKYLKKAGIENFIELDWWQSHQLSVLQDIILVPAHHWSMRRPGDRNKALWGGFWIESDQLQIYFAGDTGYGAHFQQIQQRLGSPNVSILPIGAYEPRWFMRDQHMNPDDAVMAHLDLKSRLSIATHHRTFRLSGEGVDDPVIQLHRSLQQHHLREREFLTPDNGETVIYP